jgi:hypothetical protein
LSTRTEFTLANGGTVVVESQGTGAGVTAAGRGRFEKAGESLRDSLDTVVRAAADVMDAFSALPRRPDELEVQFGVSLDGSVGAIIASGTAGVHLDVTLRWSPRNSEAEKGA